MVRWKYWASLWASRREALYRPFSREMMVCRVTPTASASYSWVMRPAFLSWAMRFFKSHIPPCEKVKLALR